MSMPIVRYEIISKPVGCNEMISKPVGWDGMLSNPVGRKMLREPVSREMLCKPVGHEMLSKPVGRKMLSEPVGWKLEIEMLSGPIGHDEMICEWWLGIACKWAQQQRYCRAWHCTMGATNERMWPELVVVGQAQQTINFKAWRHGTGTTKKGPGVVRLAQWWKNIAWPCMMGTTKKKLLAPRNGETKETKLLASRGGATKEKTLLALRDGATKEEKSLSLHDGATKEKKLLGIGTQWCRDTSKHPQRGRQAPWGVTIKTSTPLHEAQTWNMHLMMQMLVWAPNGARHGCCRQAPDGASMMDGHLMAQGKNASDERQMVWAWWVSAQRRKAAEMISCLSARRCKLDEWAPGGARLGYVAWVPNGARQVYFTWEANGAKILDERSSAQQW
jgi:hypothetical protein